MEFLIEREELDGPFNLAAPNPLPNREFMAALRWAWDVPNGLPAPSLAIKLGAIFLRTEPELVLQSCRAVPGRLLDAGFRIPVSPMARSRRRPRAPMEEQGIGEMQGIGNREKIAQSRLKPGND